MTQTPGGEDSVGTRLKHYEICNRNSNLNPNPNHRPTRTITPNPKNKKIDENSSVLHFHQRFENSLTDLVNDECLSCIRW